MKKIFVILILFICLSVTGIGVWDFYTTHKYSELNKIEDIYISKLNNIDEMVSIYKAIDIFKSKGIVIDDSIESKLNVETIDFLELGDKLDDKAKAGHPMYAAYMLYLDYKNGAARQDEIIKILNKYYSNDLQMFWSSSEEYDKNKRKEYLHENIGMNITILNALNNTQLLEQYNLENALANVFNEIANNIESDEDVNDVGNIFYYLLSINKCNLIDYNNENVKDILKDYGECDSNDISLDAIEGVIIANDYNELLNNNNSLKKVLKIIIYYSIPKKNLDILQMILHIFRGTICFLIKYLI